MEKLLFILGFISLPFISNAQYGIINTTDTSRVYPGYYTNLWVYEIKDSYTIDSTYFRVYSNFIIDRLRPGYYSTAPDNIVWSKPNGQLRVSSMDSLFKSPRYSWNSLPNKPILFSGAYTDLTGKPTIPTNTNQLTNGSGFITSEVDGSITNEIELPSQTSNAGRALVTNGTSASWGKRQETYTGTTAGSGTYTVTYTTAYSVTPNVQFNVSGGTTTNTARLTASSTTGFTITANNRVEVLGLLPTYPVLNGLVVDLLVTEK